MEAIELRIGNFIQHNNNIITVKGISPHCNDYAVNTDDTWVYLKNCLPIQLTEEWLLKFGFENGDYNWFRLYFEPNNVDDSDCFTYNISSKMLCLESFYSGEKKGSIQLLALGKKYVHQLQNLYFALTGEELIKTD